MSSQLTVAVDRRSPLARARGWTLEQDQKLERGIWRSEWRYRAQAQRLIHNMRSANSTGDVPGSAAESPQERPREHRSRRSQRSTDRGDPSPSADDDPPSHELDRLPGFRAASYRMYAHVGRRLAVARLA
jgi:hypothetical protein